MVFVNAVMDNILTRRSVRSYTAQPVAEEDLKTIVKAGRYAASGINRQPWHFVAVQETWARKALTDTVMSELGRGSDPFYGAPAVILVFGLKDPEHGMLTKADCSLALGNMMLAAHSLGLGSCWINCAIELFNTQKGMEMQTGYGVPEEYACFGSLCLGYPDAPLPEAKPRRENAETFIL